LISQQDQRTPAIKRSFPLSALLDQVDSLNNDATLFAPPTERFEIRDWGYYYRLLGPSAHGALAAEGEHPNSAEPLS
jgi:hypothetical protein